MKVKELSIQVLAVVKNDITKLAQVRQSRLQTAGEVNYLGDPQYLGVISVRIDLSSMDAPDPANLFYGYLFALECYMLETLKVEDSRKTENSSNDIDNQQETTRNCGFL